jgi:WD40 repeat protein
MRLQRATLVISLCCLGIAAGAVTVLKNMGRTQSVWHTAPVLRQIRTMQSRTGVTGVAWSPDGQILASYSNFGTLISLWDVHGSHLRDIERVGPSLDNSILFLAGGRELLTPATLQSREDNAFAFSLWDVNTGRDIRAIRGPQPVRSNSTNRASIFALSPDGQAVAAITYTPFGPVTVYSTTDWSILNSQVVYAPRASTPTSVAFSADSKLLAVGVLPNKLALLDWRHPETAPTLLDVYRPVAATRGVGSVAFSPDHRQFATGAGLPISAIPEQSGEDASLKLWTLTDHSLVASYSGPLAPVRQLSWSPDGRYLAVAAGDHTLRVFTPGERSGAEAVTASPGVAVLSAMFSPDGRLVAAATGSAISIFSIEP